MIGVIENGVVGVTEVTEDMVIGDEVIGNGVTEDKIIADEVAVNEVIRMRRAWLNIMRYNCTHTELAGEKVHV
jgi:hypothetical protein